MLIRKKNRFASPKRQKEKRMVILIKTSLFLFVVLVVFVLSIFISKVDRININKITIKNEGSSITEDEIKNVAEEDIKGNFFGLYPKTNIFLYQKDKIKTDIYNKFNKIKSVDIENISFSEIKITIDERSPHSLWCGFEIKSEEKCYFLDETGYIYSEAPTFSGNVFFKNYGNIKKENPIGSIFLGSEKFKEISFFIKSMKDINLVPFSFFAKENDDFEIYLEDSSLKYNFSGGKIIFNKNDNLGEIFDNLKTILKENALTKEFDYAVQLDYIDLRFGSKIFYKFK